MLSVKAVTLIFIQFNSFNPVQNPVWVIQVNARVRPWMLSVISASLKENVPYDFLECFDRCSDYFMENTSWSCKRRSMKESELFRKYPKTLDHSKYRLFERIPEVPGTSNNRCLTVSWRGSAISSAKHTGPRSAVGNVSGYRCVSDCRSRGREFDPGPVPFFRGDWPWNNFYGHSPPFRWFIQEGLLSVTSESMCTNYWLTACSSLPRKKCG